MGSVLSYDKETQTLTETEGVFCSLVPPTDRACFLSEKEDLQVYLVQRLSETAFDY